MNFKNLKESTRGNGPTDNTMGKRAVIVPTWSAFWNALGNLETQSLTLLKDLSSEITSKKNKTNIAASVPIKITAGIIPIVSIKKGVKTLKTVIGRGPSIGPGQIIAAMVSRRSLDTLLLFVRSRE